MTVEKEGEGPWTFSGDAIEEISATELKLRIAKAVGPGGTPGFNPTFSGDVTVSYKGSSLVAQFHMG